MDKKKKVAIITGSASGIGAATAIELSKRGWHVVINYSKSEAEAKKVAAKCKDSIVVQADVGDDAQCRKLVQAAMDKWGRVDALVNNAGTTKFVKHADLDGLSADDFLRIYRLNVVGPFQMARACAAALKANRGAIVNVSSVASLLGTGSSIAYAASKSALNSVTKSLARVLGPEVRVNSILPGAFRTDVAASWKPGTWEKVAVLGRIGEPDEIVGAALYFASDASSFTTGATLRVDGGIL